MKAMVLDTPNNIISNPLGLKEVPLPEPERNQVRIKISYCGACHTDLHIAEGDIQPSFYPIIPGHQIVGIVDAVGKEVRETWVGKRIGVPWLYRACGECDYCQGGNENLCQKAEFTGYSVNGGYAEYVIAQENYILPLPDSIDDQGAAPLLCAGIIGYRSLRQAGIQPHSNVGLVGFGASAHLALQVAKYWGCNVYVFTRAEIHRRHAVDLGADWVGGVEDMLPNLLDHVVTFAPSGKLIPPMLMKLRPGGTIAINAIALQSGFISKIPYNAIYMEKILTTVANATYQDGLDFIGIAEKAQIHADFTVYDLDGANQALSDMKYSRLNGAAVLAI